jgi:Rrf2 family transcriptional regulator, cysteine metabolism repressor
MISSRAKYATRAMLELALRYDAGPILIQDIATAQNIPVRFLEQILLQLKTEGFVASRKGPGGGYQLAAPPEKITLGAVVRYIEGPLAPISCVSVTQYEACGCPDPDTCGLRQAFKEARDALANVLDRTTYADILRLQKERKERQASVLDYVI